MNPWQMAQQLKFLLQTVTWPGGDVVFGEQAVFVYAGTRPDDSALPGGFPFALITFESARADQDDPDLMEQDFMVITVVNTAGDPLGEFGLIGGSRPDAGKSEGAGSAEVGERVRAAVQKLTGYDGAPLIVSGSSAPTPEFVGQSRHVTVEQFTVTALCTSQLFNTPPQHMQLTGDTFSWFGVQCAARFDFLQFRVGWITGTTPAADAADLTEVYTGTDPFCAIDATHLVPGRTYSIVADYSPRGKKTAEGSSAPDAVGAFVTV